VLRQADGRVAGVRVTDSLGQTREVSARMVVGADGVRSKLAGWFAAPVLDRHPAETALFYTYFEGLDADGFEFDLGDGGFCGVFPTHDAQACVWVCGPAGIADRIRGGGDRIAAFIELIAGSSPSLAARLREARPASGLRGVLRLPNHRRQPAGAGWALVGDAGYHRDPITGHGITDAFRDAEFLATAVDFLLRGEQPERVALGNYQRRRDAAIADIYRITCALSQFPARAEFLRLQKRLSRALDAEASLLADLPMGALATTARAA
jgi:flavin-dependent dehydrogenase